MIKHHPAAEADSALNFEAVAASPALAKASARAEPSGVALLTVLCLTHAFVDFCGGITAPMVPRLEEKFHLTLGGVAAIISFMGLAANFSQPFAGWLMDRSKTARIVILTPFLAAFSFLIGLTHEPWQAQILFLIAGTAIGIFHPCAYILAQQTMPRRPAMASAIFISFGVVGVSLGTMVSGYWMKGLGFQGFHVFFLPGFIVTLLLLIVGMQRINLLPYLHSSHPHQTDSEAASSTHDLHFAVLWTVGFLMAFENGTLLFFVPTFFKMLYGSEALGGQACFAFALLGGASSYFYAHRGDLGNPLRVAMTVQLISLAPIAGFFFFPSYAAKLIMMMLMGLTLGGTIPLVMSLARNARGLTLGLRTSFLMGGIWGVTGIANLGMAQLPDIGFKIEQVMAIMAAAPLLTVPLLIHAARRYENV